eukprot:TRINITY_DN3676_c0_g2_i2.p1 TRINITY_DN3676_c0_g2~~TRINITY_DN3676_c0_g2_i2.p1  ORF type:complete len:155 (+),score=18.68 TRINITY_DN3676_c0_g2_i2:753-1217(+)
MSCSSRVIRRLAIAGLKDFTLNVFLPLSSLFSLLFSLLSLLILLFLSPSSLSHFLLPPTPFVFTLSPLPQKHLSHFLLPSHGFNSSLSPLSHTLEDVFHFLLPTHAFAPLAPAGEERRQELSASSLPLALLQTRRISPKRDTLGSSASVSLSLP